MNKSTDYVGQPIFSQLLSLLDKGLISQTVDVLKANRCYKSLFFWDHLVSMLCGVYTHCTSIREIIAGLELCHGKLNHLNLKKVPARSTFSDGNLKRPSAVFGSVYQKLYAFYQPVISDSRLNKDKLSQLYIIDSSTISPLLICCRNVVDKE